METEHAKENGGTHEQKTLSTPAAAGTQAGRLPLPHNPFRWAVLPLDRTLEAEIYRDRDLKRCAECGGVFVPKSNRGKYCPDCAARVHRRQKTESERKRRSAVDS